MQLALSEEISMMAETATRFALVSDSTDETSGHQTGLDWKLIRQASELGFLDSVLPESKGGMGLDKAGQALLLCRLAEGSAGLATAIATHVCATKAVSLSTVDGLVETITGSQNGRPGLVGLGFPELTADGVRIENGRLIGSLICPLDPETCRHVVVEAGATILLFEAEKLSAFREPSYCGTGLDDLPMVRLNVDIPVDEGKPIDIESDALPSLRSAYKLLLAAIQVGNARSALKTASEYAQDRRQTGRAIIDHQSVRAIIANMVVLLHAAESFVLRAAADEDSTTGTFDLCRQAFVFSGWACERVCLDAIQTLGGYGYMKDYPLERRLRDCKSLQALTGDHIWDALGIGIDGF